MPKAPLLTSFLKSRCFRLLLTLGEINSLCKVLYKSRRWTYQDFRLRINPTFAVRWPGNRFVEAEPIFLNLEPS